MNYINNTLHFARMRIQNMIYVAARPLGNI